MADRRIGGAGGGSDKGSGRGGGTGAVVAAAIGMAVAVGGGGTAAFPPASALDASSAVHAALRTKTAKAKSTARAGQPPAAVWRQLGLRPLRSAPVREAAMRDELRCLGQSTGQVRDFFAHTPCRALHRGLFTVADDHGAEIVVSVVWVRLPSIGSALRFKDVIDVPGSGDITPLGAEVLGLGGVRFTAEHYESRRSRTQVGVVEAEAVSGRPPGELLDAVAEVAAHFPPPR